MTLRAGGGGCPSYSGSKAGFNCNPNTHTQTQIKVTINNEFEFRQRQKPYSRIHLADLSLDHRQPAIRRMITYGEVVEAVHRNLPGGRESRSLNDRLLAAVAEQPELDRVELGQRAFQLANHSATIRVHHPAAHPVQQGQRAGRLAHANALHLAEDFEAASE